MTPNSYGNKQYIAVQGREAAFKLAAAIMEARNCQVMVQCDDADIYIVSWANRYDDGSGEQFVFMDEGDQEMWSELKNNSNDTTRIIMTTAQI